MASTNNNMAASPNKNESDQLTRQIEDLSINSYTSTICANCGKDISHPNICNKCKAATYCNAVCKKKHRHKHKDACEKRVAELYEEELERKKRAAELYDEKLFNQPPPAEDCPICMLPIPSLYTESKYKGCCGKIICSGCIYAVKIRDGGVGLCPFCRTPTPTPEGGVEQYKKRMKLDDVEAIYNLGGFYYKGYIGFPQDHAKALELWHRAAELGSAKSYYSIGVAYYDGEGVERDEKKAIHYYELAAMRGHVDARHNLGISEGRAGNMVRAFKHFMIAAGFGYKGSLKKIQVMFMNGFATKDDYAKALQAYQAYLVEIKSAQRDEAAAYSTCWGVWS